MRHSRTDLVPMLAIIGGAAFGVLTFGSFLVLRSPFDDMPVPDPVVAHFATEESATGVVFRGDRVQYDPVEILLLSPSDAGGEPRLYLRTVDQSATPGNGAPRTRP